MDAWLSYLLAIAALLILAPLIAWMGRKYGKAVKGGAGLAFVLLGIGHVMDPPARHIVEAVGGEEEPSDEMGEPKDPTRGS